MKLRIGFHGLDKEKPNSIYSITEQDFRVITTKLATWGEQIGLDAEMYIDDGRESTEHLCQITIEQGLTFKAAIVSNWVGQIGYLNEETIRDISRTKKMRDM